MAIMRIKNILLIFLFVFLLGAPLFSQENRQPAAAASGPALEVGAGYAYVSMDTPSAQRVGLNGFNADGLIQFTPHWGGTLDFTYARAGNALGTGHADSLVSALVGPVIFPVERRRNGVFLHALVGVAWINGAVPVTKTTYFAGWEDRPSYALGGGFEHSLAGPFAIHGGVDLLHTTFVNSTGATQGQNNIRLTGTLVYRFGRR
jgi:hypothetical protein